MGLQIPCGGLDQIAGAARQYGTTPPLPEFDRTFDFYETHGFGVAGEKKMKVLL